MYGRNCQGSMPSKDLHCISVYLTIIHDYHHQCLHLLISHFWSALNTLTSISNQTNIVCSTSNVISPMHFITKAHFENFRWLIQWTAEKHKDKSQFKAAKAGISQYRCAEKSWYQDLLCYVHSWFAKQAWQMTQYIGCTTSLPTHFIFCHGLYWSVTAGWVPVKWLLPLTIRQILHPKIISGKRIHKPLQPLGVVYWPETYASNYLLKYLLVVMRDQSENHCLSVIFSNILFNIY